MDIQLHLFYGYTECICPCGYPRPARPDAPVPSSRKRPGSGITEATSFRCQRPTRQSQGQLLGQEKRVLKAIEGIANPSWGRGGAESPLRALLTSLEPRGLRAASRGTRCPQSGGWGRAPARRTAPSPDSAPPLPQSKRWRTRKLPRTGTDFRANRAAALALSGGSDAIRSCGRRAEMSKVESLKIVVSSLSLKCLNTTMEGDKDSLLGQTLVRLRNFLVGLSVYFLGKSS
nr:uncharacterized protein LOC119625655 [Chlorocebus sabaeus]